ncbi:MAG TPA: ribonuclease HII [bacterium]|nr:MAG: Ribonuclease HII [bacterium ADurb.Bin236]HOC93795.1 ribonuclease HII [bacterium]HOY62129.1 ribonuclease HII [bacterium]HPI75155.1 ribonuclease HII [bacterium]HPN95009.1 ribonuclease HII [bacterium]
MAKKNRGLSQSFEIAAISCGFSRVAGADEAGRGPLAGPVVAAAVVISDGCVGAGIRDSKKIAPKRRERIYETIIESSAARSIITIGAPEIDRINIYRAALYAMKLAVEGLSPAADFAYIDGNARIDIDIAQHALVGGDSLCCSVAAASILAKVTRDRMMVEYDEIYPGYGFARNKGYGTSEHMEALRRLGPCPIHRRSFAPVKEALER